VRAIDLDLGEVFGPSILAIFGEGSPGDRLAAYADLDEYGLLLVDASNLERVWGPLPAATSVGLFDETALTSHEANNIGASSRKTLAECRRTNAEDLCCNIAVDLEDIAQHVCQSMIAVQAKQHCRGTSYPDFGKQQRIFSAYDGDGESDSRAAAAKLWRRRWRRRVRLFRARRSEE